MLKNKEFISESTDITLTSIKGFKKKAEANVMHTHNPNIGVIDF